jgi:hypothetical protein
MARIAIMVRVVYLVNVIGFGRYFLCNLINPLVKRIIEISPRKKMRARVKKSPTKNSPKPALAVFIVEIICPTKTEIF